MENKDKEYMRFLAACFIMANGASAKLAIQQADELLMELESEKSAGGIVDIVAKRKRTKS
jgi:hypothetical protein